MRTNSFVLRGAVLVFAAVSLTTSLAAGTPPETLPPAPQDVGAIAESPRRVAVMWFEMSGGLPIARFTVYRGATPNSLVRIAATLKPIYVDHTVHPSSTYYYGVTATDGSGNTSPMSSIVQVTTP